MRHYRPFEKPGYVQRSIDNNPRYKGFNHNRISGLEDTVEDVSVEDTNSTSLLRHAATFGVSLFAATLVACTSGAVPVEPQTRATPTSRSEQTLEATVAATPTSTPEIIIDFDELSTPIIPTVTFDGTYDAIFHFQEPGNSLEEYVRKKIGDVRYMSWLRTHKDFEYKTALVNFTFDVFGQLDPTAVLDVLVLYKNAFDAAKLKNDFYISLDTFLAYHMSRDYNQTIVPAEPNLLQELPNGEKKPIDELVMDQESYNRLIQDFLAQAKSDEKIQGEGPLFYEVIFPFPVPSSGLEEDILKKTDVDTYTNFVLAKNNFELDTSLDNLVVDFFGNDYTSISPDELDLYKFAIKFGRLKDVYVSFDTVKTYLNSLSTNQTPVDAEPSYFRRTATGELIPMENPVVDRQSYEELKRQFLDNREIAQPIQIPSEPLEWNGYRGPFNLGYINVDVPVTELRRTSSEKEWEFTIESTNSPEPVSVLGNQLFANLGTLELLILSVQNGNLESSILIDYSPLSAYASLDTEPTISNETLFIPGYMEDYTWNGVVAIDANTQGEKWRREMGATSAPIIDMNSLYVVGYENNALHSIDILNGETNWAFTLNDIGIISAPPLITNDAIYFISHNFRNMSVYALDKDGNLKWKADAGRPLGGGIVNGADNLVIIDNFLVWRSHIGAGVSTCIEAIDLYLGDFTHDYCDDPISSIVSDGKEAYVAHSQKITKLAIEDERLKQVGTIDHLEGSEITDMLLTNNILFVARESDVLSINRGDFSARERIQDTKLRFKSLSFSDGALYVSGWVPHSSYIQKFSIQER